jgi:2-dehydropantoate 2-reductase
VVSTTGGSVAAGGEARHLAVVGVGGVGGYFGGRIAAAVADGRAPGWAVHFVASGDNLTALREAGLTLDAAGERLVCRPASVVGSLAEVPLPDVVLVCVKGYDLDEAARQVASRCHAETAIVPLLNGVDVYERIRRVAPVGCVLPACALVGTHLEHPGVVRQVGEPGRVYLGPDPARPRYSPEPLTRLLEAASIASSWSADSRPAIWEKFLFISAFGLVTATSGKTVGEVLLDESAMGDATGIMDEVLRIAALEGIDMRADAIEAALAKARAFPFETRTSLQRDVEGGRRHEGDLFGGAITRLGEQHGVDTPCTRRVYARLRG